MNPSRLNYIDFLRGVACLLVLLYHESGYGILVHDPSITPLLQPLVSGLLGLAHHGYLGVHLFLVLSGFCLMWPLVRHNPETILPLDLKTFVRRRAQRIVPPYYVALVFFLVLELVPDLPLSRATLWWDIPVHLLFLHNCFPSTSWTINGSFWSLGLEMQLYLVFPLVLLFIRRQGIVRCLAATLALAVVWQWLAWKKVGYPTDFGLVSATYYALPGRLFEFVCGAVAAMLVARRDPELTRRAGQCAVVLLVVALLVTGEQTSQFGCWVDSLWGATFAATLVGLGLSNDAPWLARPPFRALTSLGVVSYSVYLLHQPLLQIAAYKLTRLGLPYLVLLPVALGIVLPFLVSAGRVFYRFVEAPGQFRSPAHKSLKKSKTMSEQPGSPS